MKNFRNFRTETVIPEFSLLTRLETVLCCGRLRIKKNEEEEIFVHDAPTGSGKMYYPSQALLLYHWSWRETI